MILELTRNHTNVTLSDEPWQRGIQRIVVEGKEIPFLLPALTGHHFFTGAWPPPPEAIDYEPHVSPGYLTRRSAGSAVWHQPATPYTQVETRIQYTILEPGTIEARFETRSHAASYPYDYVGLFWGTIAAPGGQRGFHTLMAGDGRRVRWYYFQGGGDNLSPRANTILGPGMPPAAHSPEHPPTYFFAEACFAEARRRFALPIQVARWRDLYYCLEVASAEVAFTDVLLGTAVGGPSWDVYWRLRAGEAKELCCRLTIGEWPGWKAVEDRYRSWPGCIEPSFVVEPSGGETQQAFASPESLTPTPDGGLALSRRLFELRGRPLLAQLGLLDRCSVGCIGGTSQNAGLDDETSRDHVWGPYLTFLLPEDDWLGHHERLEEAVREMPDEVSGRRWVAYEGPEPRKTAVWQMDAFLRMLTGLDRRPETDREWLEHLCRVSFLGRRWTERLYDAEQGEILHDPDKQFTERWRHWTAYVPPDIQRALLARSLFRVWNAGPEYNLKRAAARGDRLAFALCLNRFADEVLELAFCWNEQFVPPYKWRLRQFHRLAVCPAVVREGLETLWDASDADRCLRTGEAIVYSIKLLIKDLYHVPSRLDEPLAVLAHAVRDQIEDAQVKDRTPLEW